MKRKHESKSNCLVLFECFLSFPSHFLNNYRKLEISRNQIEITTFACSTCDVDSRVLPDSFSFQLLVATAKNSFAKLLNIQMNRQTLRSLQWLMLFAVCAAMKSCIWKFSSELNADFCLKHNQLRYRVNKKLFLEFCKTLCGFASAHRRQASAKVDYRIKLKSEFVLKINRLDGVENPSFCMISLRFASLLCFHRINLQRGIKWKLTRIKKVIFF